MPTTLTTAVLNYLRSGKPAQGTQPEYQTTLRKWKQGWRNAHRKVGRKEIRDFLDWVYNLAVAEHGTNQGRTANKAREQLRDQCTVLRHSKMGASARPDTARSM